MSNRNELIILEGIVVGFHNAYHSYYVRNYICQTIRGSYPGNFKLRVYTTPLQLI